MTGMVVFLLYLFSRSAQKHTRRNHLMSGIQTAIEYKYEKGFFGKKYGITNNNYVSSCINCLADLAQGGCSNSQTVEYWKIAPIFSMVVYY